MRKLLCMAMFAGMTMMAACHNSPANEPVSAASAQNAAAKTDAAQTAPAADAGGVSGTEDEMIKEIVVRENDVLLPGITIDLQFEDEARAKLLELGESVIVSYIVDLYPEDPVPGYEIASDGTIGLGNQELELFDANTHAVIHHVTGERKLYDALNEKNRNALHVNVNVFSGRRADENNILDCGLVDGPLMENGGRAHTVSCKLL